MTTSESLINLAPALVAVHGKVKPVLQNATGEKGDHYADVGAMREATRKLLTRHGLCVIQAGGFDKTETIILHTSGEWIRFEHPMSSDERFGPRYGLLLALGLVEEQLVSGPPPDYIDEMDELLSVIEVTYGEDVRGKVYRSMSGLSRAQKLVTLRRFSNPSEIVEEAARLQGMTIEATL